MASTWYLMLGRRERKQLAHSPTDSPMEEAVNAAGLARSEPTDLLDNIKQTACIFGRALAVVPKVFLQEYSHGAQWLSTPTRVIL